MRGVPRPGDVGDDGVAERGPHADELAAVEAEVGEIPVEPGAEPRREPGGDVRREHRRGEEHGVGPGCSTSAASASTRGCGSGAASAGSSTT